MFPAASPPRPAGFHTYDYARHFISSSTRILGLEGTPEGVESSSGVTRVAAFPIGALGHRTQLGSLSGVRRAAGRSAALWCGAARRLGGHEPPCNAPPSLMPAALPARRHRQRRPSGAHIATTATVALKQPRYAPTRAAAQSFVPQVSTPSGLRRPWRRRRSRPTSQSCCTGGRRRGTYVMDRMSFCVLTHAGMCTCTCVYS